MWTLKQDEQIMAWAVGKPEDWQLGGKCDAYLWGSGRHGQLCETGRAALTPHLTSSFKSAQQVKVHMSALVRYQRLNTNIHGNNIFLDCEKNIYVWNHNIAFYCYSTLN